MNIPTEPFHAHLRKHDLPTIEELRARYSYDRETGIVSGSRGACGFFHPSSGYIMVRISKQIMLAAHRLAFALVEGRWPHLVDHDDRDRTNNRWLNLIEKTSSGNMRNRGALNISRATCATCSQGFTWHISVRIDGRLRQASRIHFCRAVEVRQKLISERVAGSP